MKKLFPALLTLLFATTLATAADKDPIETVKSFIAGVAEGDRAKIEQTFDWQYAHQHFSDLMKGINANMPWTQQENKDTLLYHFTRADKENMMETLRAHDLSFKGVINTERGLALIHITQQKKAKQSELPKTFNVALRNVDGTWKVTRFPEFFPLDPWEVVTGYESARNEPLTGI